MTKKYEFTGETKEYNGVTLHRIKSIKDFDDVLKGDIGGWIEKEENLSQEGNAWVYDNAKVWGNAEVADHATVGYDAVICDNAKVYDYAKVYGNAEVYGNAKVYGDAEVFSQNHVMTIGAIGSRNDFTTFYRGKDNQIMVKCGCFNGTIDEFVEKVKQTHGNNKYALVYLSAVETAKLQIDLSDEDAESEE